MRRGVLYSVVSFLVMALVCGCGQSSDKKPALATNTQTPQPVTEPFLAFDSASLEKIILTNLYPDTISQHLRAFYGGRNYQYVWFIQSGLAEQGSNFLHAQ